MLGVDLSPVLLLVGLTLDEEILGEGAANEEGGEKEKWADHRSQWSPRIEHRAHSHRFLKIFSRQNMQHCRL